MILSLQDKKFTYHYITKYMYIEKVNYVFRVISRILEAKIIMLFWPVFTEAFTTIS